MAAGSLSGMAKLVAAVHCVAILMSLHLRRADAFSNPLRSARIMYSGSGVTRPQIPKFDCDVNKTLYMEDFLRLPDKDKIFLTRCNCIPSHLITTMPMKQYTHVVIADVLDYIYLVHRSARERYHRSCNRKMKHRNWIL